MTESTKKSSGCGFLGAQVPFVVAVVILVTAATIFNVLNLNLGLHFKKEAVPQPRDFHELPALMGNWLQISQDTKLDPQTEEVLGTQQYCYRDYIQVENRGEDLLTYFGAPAAKDAGTSAPATQPDTPSQAFAKATTLDEKVVIIQAALKDKTAGEISLAIQSLQQKTDGGVVDMGLTYYTGLVDTVAHIPDRCYIADGYEPSSYTEPVWNLTDGKNGNDQKLQVRFIAFDDSSGSNRVPKCVAYLFHSNGQYMEDPLDVRRTLENLTERYGYYAKIELMTIVKSSSDTATAQGTMTEFLTAAKPYIETCFPDWSKLQHTK
jgi:hypothetical protein